MNDYDYNYCPLCGSSLKNKIIEGINRQVCETGICEYVYWNNPIPVVAALVEYNNKVLLARNKAWPEKLFGLITGFVEKGESPEEAAIREVKEELSLEAEVVSLIGIYPFHQKNELLISYHLSAKGDIKLNEEIAEVKLIIPEDLKPKPFGTGFAIIEWLKKRSNSN